MNTLKDLLDYGLKSLAPTSDTPRSDVEYLLGFYLNVTRATLLTWPERLVLPAEWLRFEDCIIRRQQGEPIAYICGQKAFWTFDLSVTPDTLIPRPETELLVELAINTIPTLEKNKRAGQAFSILDLGTGSGAIALALAQAYPFAQVTATDNYPATLDIAKFNAAKYELSNIQFCLSNWLAAIPAEQKFHVIVSNPPYIDPSDTHLSQGDLRFEPPQALIAQEHGLADIYTIIEEARAHLYGGGYLFLEHGYNQHLAVQGYMEKWGYCQVESFLDLGGHFRVTMGTWRPSSRQNL